MGTPIFKILPTEPLALKLSFVILKGRPPFKIYITEKMTLTVWAKTVARAAPAAPILNNPTNAKSPIILTIQAISMKTKGILESPTPLNSPLIAL